MTIRALAPLLLLAAASPARAGTIELVPTCVAVDGKDTLAPLERTQALTMLRHVLEEQDLLVVDTGCVDTYTILTEHDGDQLIAHVRGPAGGRKLHVMGLADLPSAYQRMVSALREAPVAPAAPRVAPYLTGPLPTVPAVSAAPPSPVPAADLEDPSGTAASSAIVPIEPAEPAEPAESVEEPATTPASHNVFSAQLGDGGMGGADAPRSFSLGYRREFDGNLFDAAFTGFGSGSGMQPVSGQRFLVKLLHELTPEQASSFYVGGGLGVSGSTIQVESSAYSGNGLEAVATAGVDLLRDHRGLRLFLQADAILPLYEMQSIATGETEYAGTFMVSLGVGVTNGR